MRSRARSVLIRGVRWRLTGSLLVVVTAAIAVGAAIVGPLFLRAGGDSLVRQTAARASVARSSFELVPVSRATTLDGLAAEQHSLLASAHLDGLYGPPEVRTMTAGLDIIRFTGQLYLGGLTYRSGICSVLHFRAGGCGTAPGDAVVSDRMARRFRLTVGSTLIVDNVQHLHPYPIHITGVFAVPDFHSNYWFADGASHFTFGQDSGRPFFLPLTDDLFVASPAAFAVPSSYVRSLSIQSTLRPGVVGIGNAATVRQAMLGLQQRAEGGGFQIDTGLPSLLSGPLHQQTLMATVVVVAAFQLVLLAIWVLTSVLMRSADLRRAELRVARLRGFPVTTLLAVSITEPAVLCALGVVAGTAAGWLVVRAAVSILFTRGTVVQPDGWTWASFAAVLLTVGVVLGLSAVRLMRSSGLGASASPSDRSRSRAVVDVSILAVSVVALIGAVTSGALSARSNPVAAAAPAVVALGISVIAIRIVEYLCRRASDATLDTSAVASFLAVSRIARRPAVLREGRTLVIAVGLACFAVSAWSVARSNRLIAATFATGARTVVTVSTDDLKLQRAVRTVDPDGRFAMAAVVINTASSSLVAVDASRLAAVAAWPSGTTRISAAAVGRALTPGQTRDVITADGALDVTASVSASGAARRYLPHLELEAWIFDPVQGSRTVGLGTLVPGRSVYRGAPLAGCPCRLTGIGVLPNGKGTPRTGLIQLGLGALNYHGGVGTTPHPRAVLSAAAWRPSLTGVRVTAAGSELGFAIPMAAVADDVGLYRGGPAASLVGPPAVLPAVGASQAGFQGGTLATQGLDGNTITVRQVVAASSLPRIGPTGVFVDLGRLEGIEVAPTFAQASEQVWLGPHAPADAVSRLRAAGLPIESVERSSVLVDQAGHSGPALAYEFMLLATLVALLVAAVGTFSVLAAGGRQRATELMALQVTGVPRPQLRRSLAIEAMILAGTALFGVAAGAGSAAIVLPSLPQLGGVTDAPLSYALPVLLIAAVALGAVLVVGLATALAARGILASMSPSLLRAPDDDAD